MSMKTSVWCHSGSRVLGMYLVLRLFSWLHYEKEKKIRTRKHRNKYWQLCFRFVLAFVFSFFAFRFRWSASSITRMSRGLHNETFAMKLCIRGEFDFMCRLLLKGNPELSPLLSGCGRSKVTQHSDFLGSVNLKWRHPVFTFFALQTSSRGGMYILFLLCGRQTETSSILTFCLEGGRPSQMGPSSRSYLWAVGYGPGWRERSTSRRNRHNWTAAEAEQTQGLATDPESTE